MPVKGVVFHCLALSASMVPVMGDEVRIENGYLQVSVDDSKLPFSVDGKRLASGQEAASLLRYLYAHWEGKKPPTLVVKCDTKAMQPGEKALDDMIGELAKRKEITVIRFPEPRGSIDSVLIQGDLIGKWEKARRKEEPASKNPEK